MLFTILFILTQSALLVCSYSEAQAYNRSLNFNLFQKDTIVQCRAMPQVKFFWAELFMLYAPNLSEFIVKIANAFLLKIPSKIISGIFLFGILIQITAFFNALYFIFLGVIMLLKKGIQWASYSLIFLFCSVYIELYI